MHKDLEEAYHFIFEDELLEEINRFGSFSKFNADDIILDIGDRLTKMPLLITGAVKILREDAEGNDLLLYFLERGDTCAMTLSCCVGDRKSEIRAVAETATSLMMIPIEKMETWTAKYKSWRNFVFQSYHERLSEMLTTIDTIAFLNMDKRIFKYLQDKAKINQNENIAVTHQEIALDLHTSRVVVSRILKKLEIEKKIALFRNQIKVLEL